MTTQPYWKRQAQRFRRSAATLLDKAHDTTTSYQNGLRFAARSDAMNRAADRMEQNKPERPTTTGTGITELRKPVVRLTVAPFHNFGPDRGRRFVVTLAPGDLLTFRASGRRAEVSARLVDIYQMILVGRDNAKRMAKLRERKAQIASRKAERKRKRDIREGNRL